MRTGNMYGPDATFLGVPKADLGDESSFSDAGAVIIGAPFDGGTSTDRAVASGLRPSGSPTTSRTMGAGRISLSESIHFLSSASLTSVT